MFASPAILELSSRMTKNHTAQYEIASILVKKQDIPKRATALSLHQVDATFFIQVDARKPTYTIARNRQGIVGRK